MRGTRTPNAAAELAWRIERLCLFGIELRAAGACLGLPRVSEFRREALPHPARPRNFGGTVDGAADGASRRRYEAHARSGHGAGCRALGIPVEALDRALREWDAAGAQRLVREAIAEAVAELDAPGWTPTRARESVAYAIRRRITPAAPQTQQGSRTSRADVRGP